MTNRPSVLGVVVLSVAILVAVLFIERSNLLERFATATPKDGVSTGTIIPVPAVTSPPGIVPQLMFVGLLVAFVAIGYAAFNRGRSS
jgi:hypothetical protein